VNGSVSTGAETYAERQLRERLSVGKNVTTHEPEAPTCPLFVNCSQITSSCIYLDWSAPFYDGGVPIVDYTVHYTVMERQTTVTARDVLFEHVLKFKLHSAEFTEAVSCLIDICWSTHIFLNFQIINCSAGDPQHTSQHRCGAYLYCRHQPNRSEQPQGPAERKGVPYTGDLQTRAAGARTECCRGHHWTLLRL